MSRIPRRQILSVAGLTLGSGIISGCTGGAFEGAASSADSLPADNEFRRRYIPICPDKTAARAYQLYPDGSCMHAVVKSIVTLVSEKEPSAVPPIFFDMFKYGHGGCGGWGTLCGGCNGGAAIIGLFYQDNKVRDSLIGQLFRWYESAELPQFVPAAEESKKFPKARANSPLCHISVDSWCVEAGKGPFNADRKERCRRMTADVAKKVVELLNARCAEEKAWEAAPSNHSSRQVDARSQPPQSCIQCHATPGGENGSNAAGAPKSVGKMGCSACHEIEAGHPN